METNVAPRHARQPGRSSRLDRRLRTRYGPTAVVTGASSGIGAAIAERLAVAGLDLVLVARRADRLDAMASGLEDRHGIKVVVTPLDLARTDGTAELAAATADLDVGLFVASAGFGTSGRFLDADIAAELEMLDVNCRAVVSQTHTFARRFADRGRGGIILLSSIVAFQGLPNAAHYAATKAYIQTLADGLRVELKPRGVDVLAAAPGPTNSGFADRADMRMGSALRPERLAEPILRSLGRRPTAMPGLRSWGLRASVAPLPRPARTAIMGQVMGQMTSHQRPA